MHLFRAPLRLFAFFPACLILLGSMSAAQANHTALRYKSMSFFGLTTKQGLSQVTGNAILQDRAGYTWIGTQDGLNRYDGHDVRTFRHDKDKPESLNRDFVNVLAEDSEGHLWIGTRGKGLDEYDPLTDKFHHYTQTGSGEDKSASDVRVLEVLKDRILFGTLQGLFSLNLNTRQIHPIHLEDIPASPPTIHDLLTLPDGTVLVASSAGLRQLNPETGLSRPFLPRILQSRPGAAEALFLDSRQQLWLAVHNHGVLLIDLSTKTVLRQFRHQADDPDSLSSLGTGTFTEDAQGNIWIGSAGGLNIYLAHNDTLIRIADSKLRPEGMTDHTVHSLYTDRNGTVWVGTHVGGVSHVTPHLVRFGKESPARYMNTPDKRILGVAITGNGDMYIGSVNGLVRRRAGKTHFEPVPQVGAPSLSSREAVYGIYASRDGTIWAGCTTGLRRLSPGESELGPREVESPYYFVAILEDQEGFLWLSRPTELLKYDPVGRKVVARLDIPHVYGLLMLAPGKLLVGGLGAIHLVDTESARILSSLEGSDHDFNTVTYLFRSRDGEIWAGTQGDGLFRLEIPADLNIAGSRLTFYTTRQGLLSNAIGAIQQSADGDLWISTINSISRLNPGTGEIRNFDDRDGALSEGYFIGSGARDQKGLIYFGGTVGLTFFSPEWIINDTSVPGIIFTDLRLDNRKIRPGEKDSPLEYPLAYSRQLIIPPRWSNINLSFSSDNYAFPAAQHFAYRMLGADESWTETDAENRFASYTNLAPGDYLFQVKATNLDGQWSSQPGEIAITVLPDWYQTPWAWLLFLLAVGGALYAFIRWRMAGLLKRNIELESRVNERTRALTEANEKLSHLARTDTLTGLLNRRAFTELFPGNDRTLPNRRNCALALLDIDFFKQFNDRYGHNCGDAVLQEMSSLLAENLRQNDIVARWGGEEFIVLLPESSLETAAEVMERLRQAVASHEFNWKGQTLRISITVGLGSCIRENLDASLSSVDKALFRGKKQGRNRLVVASIPGP
jgi:diguanylate cyclase (GGDEF)-like protein